MKRGYEREWSFLLLPPDDAICCGAHGVSKKGRDYINALFDRIIELEEKLEGRSL